MLRIFDLRIKSFIMFWPYYMVKGISDAALLAIFSESEG